MTVALEQFLSVLKGRLNNNIFKKNALNLALLNNKYSIKAFSFHICILDFEMEI